MKAAFKAVALVLGAGSFSGCVAATNTGTAPPAGDRGASHGLTANYRATDDTSGYPHGQETESGVPVMITDGNVHVMFPGSATVTRSADGVRVTHNGRTRTFSTTAVVTQAGNYHHFAPVAH